MVMMTLTTTLPTEAPVMATPPMEALAAATPMMMVGTAPPVLRGPIPRRLNRR
jgi:hypothetical protein